MEIFANFRNINTDPYLLFIKEKYKDKPITFWYDKMPSSAEELSRNSYNFYFYTNLMNFLAYTIMPLKSI
jgi:hypothetical protein